MYEQVKKSAVTANRSVAHSVSRKSAGDGQGAGTFNNPAKPVLLTNSNVSQLGRGSHGKHLHFKVTTITIQNTVTDARRFVNADHDEDLGVVPTHGAGPAQKTQADADTIAAAAVTLAANEVILDVTWNHYTKR